MPSMSPLSLPEELDVMDDFIKLFKAIPKVDAGLAASIFHFGEVDIKDLKEKLKDNGINVRI